MNNTPSLNPSSAPAESPGVHFLDYWRVIRTRKEIVLMVSILVVATGFFVTKLLPDIYEARCIIEVEQDGPDISLSPTTSKQSYNPYFLLTEYERIQTRSILEEVVRQERLQEIWGEKWSADGDPLDMDSTINLLKSAKYLTVSQHRSTTFISIAFRSEDPVTARNVANRIATVYRDYRQREAKNDMLAGLNALKDEMAQQQLKVEEAEQEVSRIRKELNLSVVGRGTSLSTMTLQQLEADRIKQQQDVTARRVRMEQILALDDEEIITSLPMFVSDAVIESLRKQWIDSQINLRLLKENLGENHPDIRQLTAGVSELKIKLDAAIRGVKQGLKADYEVARKRLEELNTILEEARQEEIAVASDRMRPFERANRRLQIEQGFFEALQARIKQEGVTGKLPSQPVTIVEEASQPRENRPVSPNLTLNMALSLVAGLGLGIGLAYFIEYLDTSIKSVEEVEQYLGLPVLGVVPQKIKLLTHEGSEGPHAETYRVLRTNLRFATGSDGGAFAVASGGVGEGKSTTLFNLAHVCANMGYKVVLVDSDMRRPVQHSQFGVGNGSGLTDVLLKGTDVNEVIQATDTENLSFLPSGRLPRGAVGVLNAGRLQELVADLKARYDYVFFDSPPVMGVSDASIIAAEMDGVFLVVQYRKYSRALSLRAKRMLENIGGRLVGVVLNNINVDRDDSYYYYSSYYSHYAGASNLEDAASAPAKPAGRKAAGAAPTVQNEEKF